MYVRLVGAGVLALAGATAAVSAVVAAWLYVPYVLAEFSEAVEFLLICGTLMVGLWFTVALPAVASFLARLAWVREVRALRGGQASPAPVVRWSLRHADESGTRLELHRAGTAVVVVTVPPDDPRSTRFRGSDREVGIVAGAPGSLSVVDEDGVPTGSVTLVRRVWSGYHRAEVQGRVLLAPIGRRRARWGLMDDTGVERPVRFTGRDEVDADLPGDLDAATLSAVLWFFALDRREAIADNYARA